MSKPVSLVRCGSYDAGEVDRSLRRALDLLGGIGQFIPAGSRVLLKPNLISAAPPEAAVTTHPSVVEAAARLVAEARGTPLLAESPGGPYTLDRLRQAYRATGMIEVAERTGLELNWDTSVVELANPSGRLFTRLELIKPCAEADVIVAIPKLKTHVLTTITGATKVMFGAVPGLSKPGYHATLRSPALFSEMLLDIIACLKPSLFVMDAVLGMDGDGPGRHGRPRPLELLLASADPVAMDVVACRIAGIDPNSIPMLKAAAARGWWDGDPESIVVFGERVEDVVVDDFRLPAGAAVGRRPGHMLPVPSVTEPFLKTALVPSPVPRRGLCSGCGRCAQACPRGAIRVDDHLAIVDQSKCIYCYCCHELCPEAAIELRTSWLGRLIRWAGMDVSRLGRESHA